MGYEPNAEDLERTRPRSNEFVVSGDWIFHTVQGEGTTMGRPITFVRLHFCNLKCDWCDTPYTWDRGDERFYKEANPLSPEDVHTEIRKAQEIKGISPKDHVYRVAFSGGEPLIQQELISQFLVEYPQYYAELETNGTIMPNEALLMMAQEGRVRFNCSPKLKNSKNKKALRIKPKVLSVLSMFPTTLFKFVVQDVADLNEIERDFLEFIPKEQISIMPEGWTVQENMVVYNRIIDEILKRRYMTHPRLQTIAFGGKQRGV